MLCFELSGCAIYGVAPCAGARIEIVYGRPTPRGAKRRTSRGCANQNAQTFTRVKMPRVALCAGTRIKTMLSSFWLLLEYVAPMRVRESK